MNITSIQNTQNRESRVIHLKLDKLLRGVEGARISFVPLDKMTDAELEDIQKEFERLREKYALLVDDDLATVREELRSRRPLGTSSTVIGWPFSQP